MRILLSAIVAAGALSSCASVEGGGVASGDILPGDDLAAYLSGVETERSRSGDQLINLQVTDVSVDSIFRDAVENAKARGDSGVALPLQSADEIVVLLRPDLDAEEAEAALARLRAIPSDCNVSKTMPAIGALVISCSDLRGSDRGGSLAETRQAAINRIAATAREDSRIAVVTANTVMTSASIVSAVLPEFDRSGEVELGEATDWGVGASRVDLLWPLLSARMTPVGVIDVGFADHVDLPMTPGLSGGWSPHNHGNHVSGIMCARHNGVGVRGVLPNCAVSAATGEFLLSGSSPIEGENAIAFQARFSEYIATVLSFMEANPDTKVINISLGYNWMPNFGADPRLAANTELRDIVRAQGRIFQAILAYAKRRDIAIFSAAGNDSTSLATPLEAEWASPFNFGAKLMKEVDGWSNGVVVEAYAQNGRRATFSNSNGDISCPGVDIRSSLAKPANAYGVMSGTSMASPYCAAAFAGLRALQPQVPLQRALQCFLGVPGRIEGRIPKMDLKAAHEACRDG